MKIVVICNPSTSATEALALRDEMERRSIAAEWLETTESDQGKGQSRQAVDDGAELVMVVGGDGTVRAVAEGMVDSGIPLAVAPAGTGNLLARNLELPDDPSDVLDVALHGSPMLLDTGEVQGEVFTVMSGAGLDAVIMEETSSESKSRFGVLAYVMQGVKHVFDQPFQASLSVDNEAPHQGSWATILVGNLGRLQGGIDLFPDSSPSDGQLDVVGLVSAGPGGTIAAGVSAATNGGEDDRLLRRTGQTIKVEFASPTTYELDGDPRGETSELVYEIRPASLTVMGTGT